MSGEPPLSPLLQAQSCPVDAQRGLQTCKLLQYITFRLFYSSTSCKDNACSWGRAVCAVPNVWRQACVARPPPSHSADVALSASLCHGTYASRYRYRRFLEQAHISPRGMGRERERHTHTKGRACLTPPAHCLPHAPGWRLMGNAEWEHNRVEGAPPFRISELVQQPSANAAGLARSGSAFR